jgi:spore germination protein
MKIPLRFIFICALLCGCVGSPKVIEDIQMLQSLGYDESDEDELKGTGGAAFISPAQESRPQNITFTGVGKTSKQIRQIIQAKSPKPIEIGRVGVVLFQEEVARKGLFEIIDALQKDPSVGRDVYLAVSKESTEELLKGDYKQSESVSQYIRDLIAQNMQRTMPKMDLHRYLFQYYGDGYDPYMPVIEQKEGHIEMTGVALFQGDKLQDIIGLNESYMMKILHEDIQKGIVEVMLSDDQQVTIQNLSSKVKQTVQLVNGKMEVVIKVKVKGNLTEAEKIDVTKNQWVKIVEKATAQQIEKEGNMLMAKFQDLHVDPLGLGEKARQKGLYQKENWDNTYSDLPITIKASVEIVQVGITE